MSVEVDGQPLKIYDKDEQTKGIERDIVRGYIASQEGKQYVVKYTVVRDLANAKRCLKSHPSISAECWIDGTEVYYDGHAMKRSVAEEIHGRRTSGTRVYKFAFSPPQTTEDETPSVNLGELGTIEMHFRRSILKNEKGCIGRSSKKKKQKISSEACTLNEKAKKGSMVGAVTTYGDASGESSPDEDPSSSIHRRATAANRPLQSWYYHQNDIKSPFMKLRLRYAPEELLIFNSHMPGKLEDENDAMQPASPSSSVVPFAEPEFDSDSDLTSVDSGYSVRRVRSSSPSDESEFSDESQFEEPNHRGIELDDERLEKRSRSPEEDELGSEEDDKKRIKVSDGIGQRQDDPIEIGDDSDDDSELLAAQEAARVARARKLEELEELQAKQAEMDRQQAEHDRQQAEYAQQQAEYSRQQAENARQNAQRMEALRAELQRGEGSEGQRNRQLGAGDVKEEVKEEAVGEGEQLQENAVAGPLRTAPEAAMAGGATTIREITPKEEVKTEE